MNNKYVSETLLQILKILKIDVSNISEKDIKDLENLLYQEYIAGCSNYI
jgi:hypothetical protein